jgi:hypothetical protein
MNEALKGNESSNLRSKRCIKPAEGVIISAPPLSLVKTSRTYSKTHHDQLESGRVSTPMRKK